MTELNKLASRIFNSSLSLRECTILFATRSTRVIIRFHLFELLVLLFTLVLDALERVFNLDLGLLDLINELMEFVVLTFNTLSIHHA